VCTCRSRHNTKSGILLNAQKYSFLCERTERWNKMCSAYKVTKDKAELDAAKVEFNRQLEQFYNEGDKNYAVKKALKKWVKKSIATNWLNQKATWCPITVPTCKILFQKSDIKNGMYKIGIVREWHPGNQQLVSEMMS